MRALTLALAFAAACFGQSAFAAQIKIGYTPSIDLAPVFIAIEEGFFAKRGLEVEMQAGNGSVMIAGISSNSLQISNPTVPTFLQAVDAGLDLVLISGDNFTKPGVDLFAVVARTGMGAKPEDFVGKKVGVSTIGAFLHVLFVEWLSKNGVDPRKVSFVEIPFPQMPDVMKAGNVDAVITVEPFVARMVGSGLGTGSTSFVHDFPPGLPVATFAMTRAYAAANPEVVKGFREAFTEGVAFMHSNPDKTRAHAAKYLKLPVEVLAKIPTPELHVALTPDGVAQWVAIMKRQDLIKGSPDPAKVIWP
jgi:NitT/TauT family transport system substrate-binding protein